MGLERYLFSSLRIVAILAAWGLTVGPGDATQPQKADPRTRGLSHTPVTFSELPGWDGDDHLAALRAFQASCERVIASVQERATNGKTQPPAALVEVCAAARKLPTQVSRADAKAFFEAKFTPHRITHSGRGGLLTGYYEPVLRASRTADGAYQTPIYKRPADLVTLIDETKGSKSGAMTHGRKTDTGVSPYFTRAQIDQGALKGRNLELVYFADPVDVFFMQIQGSARVQLTDGTKIRVNYDGKNGHPYSSIGRYLIEKGMLAADKVSLSALRAWLQSDRDRGRQVMWQNASYVFFKEMKDDGDKGPLGAMGVPLTAGRSLAVDARYHVLGSPIYVVSDTLSHTQKSGGFNRLMIAQDVGSAIKGQERGDLYFGSGEAAEKLANVTRHKGHFIVLLPNSSASADAGQPKP